MQDWQTSNRILVSLEIGKSERKTFNFQTAYVMHSNPLSRRWLINEATVICICRSLNCVAQLRPFPIVWNFVVFAWKLRSVRLHLRQSPKDMKYLEILEGFAVPHIDVSESFELTTHFSLKFESHQSLLKSTFRISLQRKVNSWRKKDLLRHH